MVKFTFNCRDGVGVGATVIGYLARAEVNIRSIDLSVADRLIRVRTASGSIVVDDEDGEKAKKALEFTRERERQLSIRNVRTFHQLMIAIPNEIGALFREIGTLARHDIYFRRLHQVESPLGVIILLELEGPVEKYAEAKQLLKDPYRRRRRRIPRDDITALLILCGVRRKRYSYFAAVCASLSELRPRLRAPFPEALALHRRGHPSNRRSLP